MTPEKIDYTLGGSGTIPSEIGVEKINMGSIRFSAENGEVLQEKLFPALEKIFERYDKPKRRSVMVPKSVIPYFRGKESHHLNSVKEKTGVEKVFLNNVKSEEGDSEMVEVVVIGHQIQCDRFMSELVKSWSTVSQRKENFVKPERVQRQKSD